MISGINRMPYGPEFIAHVKTSLSSLSHGRASVAPTPTTSSVTSEPSVVNDIPPST
jgi:hypothetical protein